MGHFLQQLGETMYKLKWWVVLSWTTILVILGVVVSQVGMSTTNSISIPGTEAQQTLERFNELFPEAGAQSAKVVVAAPEGNTINDYEAAIETLSADISKVKEVTAAISPFANPAAVSDDQSVGFVTVQLKAEAEDGTVSEETVGAIQQSMQAARDSELTVEAGGDLVPRTVGEILGVGEIIGVVVALIVLVITLGSLIAAGMPIITAIVAVGVSMAGLFALSGVIELTSTAPVLAVMLGLAVGIDYSLFIINRYRTFLKEGYELEAAAGRAIATAGNAVIFAAATVVIALAALSVVQIPFMTVMGLAAAATVAIAALVALTLVPALLGIVGLRIFSKKARRQVAKLQSKHAIHAQPMSHKTIWYKWGETLLKFRKSILFVSLAALVVIALPVTQLRLGLPTDEFAASDSSERKAYELLADGFGPGYNGPLLVVVEGLPEPTSEGAAAVQERIIAEYQKQLTAKAQEMGVSVEQLVALTPPEQQQAAQVELQKQVAQYAPYYEVQRVADRIAELEGVATAQAALVTDNGQKGVIQVTPTTGPSDQATQELVKTLRQADTIARVTDSNSVSLGVTGTTAIQIDINNKLAAALPVYLGVVVGLSFLILILAFRSILIPIKATLGFLLSVFAMFGALVAVFQWGWFGIAEAPGPIVSFIPIIAIGILFGLAMDYEFFLVSGMQEAYHHKKKPQYAVLRGFALGSRVVVAAGLIMVAVFAGFISNHDATIQSIGFALAFGILVDAFIVRMIIVPIVMSFLGHSAWWLPKWLEKRLPKISIEG